MADRYNEPEKGTRRRYEPLNENFSDLGVEVTNEVATWSDLPTPTGETSSNGQPRVYRVDADDIFVKDTGSGWSIVGGRGSSNRPLPSVHADELSNVHEFICDDSEDLAAALDAAKTTTGVKIHLGSGTTYTPFDHKSDSNPWKLSGGTTIKGHITGEDNFDTDGWGDTGSGGSVIDAAGNVLFRADAVSGINLEGFEVENYQHVLACGQRYDGSTNYSALTSSVNKMPKSSTNSSSLSNSARPPNRSPRRCTSTPRSLRASTPPPVAFISLRSTN